MIGGICPTLETCSQRGKYERSIVLDSNRVGNTDQRSTESISVLFCDRVSSLEMTSSKQMKKHVGGCLGGEFAGWGVRRGESAVVIAPSGEIAITIRFSPSQSPKSRTDVKIFESEMRLTFSLPFTHMYTTQRIKAVMVLLRSQRGDRKRGSNVSVSKRSETVTKVYLPQDPIVYLTP